MKEFKSYTCILIILMITALPACGTDNIVGNNSGTDNTMRLQIGEKS